MTPCLGDADVGSYVLPGIAEFMREQVVPAAQIITPNQFELTCLTGLPVATMEDVVDRWRMRPAVLDPDIVLITSVVRRDARARAPSRWSPSMGPGGHGWSRHRSWRVRSLAAEMSRPPAFLAALSCGCRTLPRALAHTAAVIYGLLGHYGRQWVARNWH